MEKKLQMTKYMNKDLKNYMTKSRSKEFVNEKVHANRQNIKNLSGSCNHYPRNKNKFNIKSDASLPKSVSLSNEDYIMANAQIWVHQDSKWLDDICSHWEDIIQINFYTNDNISCPICMESPVIPRTDKCGHVYCFPCLNKFLSYKSDFHNKCALCNQLIDPKRIKRAGILNRSSVKEGETLSMLLMKRDRNILFPSPIETSLLTTPKINTPESRFCNIAVCPNDDLLSIIRMEILILEDEFKIAFEEENDRITAISDALVTVKSEYDVASLSLSLEYKRGTVTDLVTIDSLKQTIVSGSVYYQSEDGGNIFMCPVNWKCMAHEFLDSDRCLPCHITAPIIDIEKFIVTSEFQNRYRYLRYLPIGSSVSFVELDLSEIISPSTFDKFYDVIQHRADARLRKQKMDDILTSKKIKHENSFNKAAGFTYLPSLMPRQETFLMSDFVPLCPVAVVREAGPSDDKQEHKKSFADMIQAKRPSMVHQMTELSVSDSDRSEPGARGISLSDCVVVKTSVTKKRR